MYVYIILTGLFLFIYLHIACSAAICIRNMFVVCIGSLYTSLSSKAVVQFVLLGSLNADRIGPNKK